MTYPISGRPGTGKTATSPNLLAILNEMEQQNARPEELATSGSVRMRAQLLADLPAGQVVEQEMAEILSAPSLGSAIVGPTWGPLPSNVSLQTVMDCAAPESVPATAVVAGMRNPEAVEELRSLFNEGAWPDGWQALAALCNSKLAADGVVHIPHPSKVPALHRSTTLSLVVVDAVLRGERTIVEEDLSHLEPALATTLESFLGWSEVGAPNKELLRGRLPALTHAWEQRHGDPLLKSRSPFKDYLRDMRDVVCRPFQPRVTRGVSGFAFGPQHDLLVVALEDPEVKMGSIRGPETGIGRHMGRRLFEVTGDDPGMWSIALQLLDGWDRSFPEWLEAVEALT